MEDDATSRRKAEHLTVAARPEAEVAATARWDEIRLLHNSLPEVDRAALDLSVTFLGRRFALPVQISGMTGGHPRATEVNRVLARVAARFNIPMGVGSQRAMIVNPALTPTYAVAREAAPDILLIANVGLPQLLPQADTPPFTTGDVRRAIDAIGAEALAVHLNFLQEAVQAGGDVNARGGLAALAALAATISVPVIAKETGAGLTARAASAMAGAGVAALVVGGAGGTSFAAVEARRAADAGDERLAALGRLFADWGVPTPAAIRMARGAGLPVIATGGIRSGLDAAKALALGADLVGLARPLLERALVSEEATVAWLEQFVLELRTAMFLVGAATPPDLQRIPYLALGATRDWLAEADRLAAGEADCGRAAT
ncbi:MAG: type 2 isopentenyl-diphosphate Delta-isomerase [Thermomicrobiales bacterium]